MLAHQSVKLLMVAAVALGAIFARCQVNNLAGLHLLPQV